MKEFRAKPDDAGSRLDVFVAGKYPQFSRASLLPLFETGAIFLNGKIAKPGGKLRLGDKVEVDDTKMFSQPEKIDLPVLYEDYDVVVINKPSGVLTHSKGALNTEATVATFLESKISDKNLSGNRAGIVHRLDRATSGVIIAAKSEDAQSYLQKQFSTRKVKKNYLAIVEGWPEPPKAIIDAPIERNPKKPQTFRVGSDGKSSQTSYRIIRKFTKNGRDYALLELIPVTGRTHQIRVHLAYIGHPVVGDRLYGKNGADYLYLHAAKLEIALPGGERRTFGAPVPEIFKEFSEGS